MFGVKLTTDEEIITYAKKLQEKGAQNVLISMAGDGAILLTADGKHYKGPAPEGQARQLRRHARRLDGRRLHHGLHRVTGRLRDGLPHGRRHENRFRVRREPRHAPGSRGTS